MSIKKYKQEAEELYPLPSRKYITTSGGETLNCGSTSRAIAFTFVRRTDYINDRLRQEKGRHKP